MTSLVPQITTVLLLFHLVVGCCFHHAHSCEVDCCQAPSAGTDDCCEHAGHELRADPKPLEHNGHEESQHECDGGICVFIDSANAIDLPAAVHSHVAWREVACSPRTGLLALRGGAPPPSELNRDAGLRVHLWFQVLLI